ncbi:MAG: sensor histidine kinase [Bacteroidetes bacterium]|nr:sensor histidine kinase [Bacteroidota bacterium]MBL7103162.1 sensor histidine kinase [Bacteroidales bacterium]
MARELQFRISAALKNIIGRDLITDDFIAVFELVKNSFDAYANKVKIAFEKDRLIIWDDGKGMDYDDIVNKWLFVAYSAKKEGIEDKELRREEYQDYRNRIQPKRYYAGAKGIGRFSCDRLGSHLILTTKKPSKKAELEQIIVNWDDFEKDTKDQFININVKHEKNPTIEHLGFKQGAIIEISGLRSDWKREKILNLKYSLEKLINPFDIIDEKDAQKKENKFTISIEAKHELEKDQEYKSPRERVNGPVKNFIFETLNVKTTQVITEIDQTGKYITTELKDRGVVIYKIREENVDFPFLEDVVVKYHLFYLNRAAKNNFTRQMGIHAVNFGSVFIYKNGFRVYPFGEVGDDTLGIDHRHQQRYRSTLSTRNLLGRIEITGENDEFKEASSRDGGLIKTASYEQLVEGFMEKSLKRLENYVVDIQWKIKEDQFKQDLSELDNIGAKGAIAKLVSKFAESDRIELLDYDKDFLNIVTEKLEELNPEIFENLSKLANKTGDEYFIKEIEEAQKKYHNLIEEIAEAERRALEEEEARRKLEEELEIERQKNTFLSANTRGISKEAQGLIHNIKLTTKNIEGNVETLIRKAKDGMLQKRELLRRLTDIKLSADKALKISKLITRSNFKEQAAKQKVDLAKYIEQYFLLYSDLYEKNQLQFDLHVNDACLWTKISVLEISIILDNLISNAEKSGAKNIYIALNNTIDNGLEMIFSDDGKGVNKKYLDNVDYIFDLGVTDTSGSGIGLYTVRSSLKSMQGEIMFIGNGIFLKGATFQLNFK